MSVRDSSKLVMAVPENSMDQIVDVLQGSFGAAAATVSGGSVFDTFSSFDHGITVPDTFLFQGLWSIDGGATWQEIGNTVPLGANANGLETLNVSGSSILDVANNTQFFSLGANNGHPAAYTVQYKIFLMARSDQDHVPNKPLIKPLRYSSKNKYMKVAVDSSINLSTGGPTTILHNLGYLPNFDVWVRSHFQSSPDDFYRLDQGSPKCLITDSSIQLPARSSSSTLLEAKAYYRIYLDA